MKITNKHNLPQEFVTAITSQEHRQGGILSASGTTNSPREIFLKKRHIDEMTEDVVDRFFIFFGLMFHEYMQNHGGGDAFREEYMETEILGEVLSGQMDYYNMEKGLIRDYKTSSAWTIVYQSQLPSWTAQQNTYAYLARMAGLTVKELEIMVIARDWMESKVEDASNYPKVPFVKVPIELWSKEKQKDYLTGKMANLIKYQDTPDNELPECTLAERWASDDIYKVFKKGNKRSMKNTASKEEAHKFAELQESNGLSVKVEFFAGESKKCPKYCGARPFCNQWAKEKASK